MSGVKKHRTSTLFAALCCAWAGLTTVVTPARAAEVSTVELRTALRSLGFLSSLQNRPSLLIGVVYVGSDSGSKAQAVRAAAELAKLAGPGSSTVFALAVPARELGQSSQHFDALYLMPLPPDSGRIVVDYATRQSVVTISSDPACLELQTCVLLVQARTSVSVVLDTTLAKTVGARFSTVFTMLVKRK